MLIIHRVQRILNLSLATIVVMSQKKPLSDNFQVSSYQVEVTPNVEILNLTIEGIRTGKPSKRMSFHQKNLRVTSAHILSSRKNKTIDFHVQRINHLPKLQEVRIHTAQNLYPGPYKITLKFKGNREILEEVFSKNVEEQEIRAHLPSIDEPESKKNATFSLK